MLLQLYKSTFSGFSYSSSTSTIFHYNAKMFESLRLHDDQLLPGRAVADPLGSNKTPCDGQEEYIEMEARVKINASIFSNKNMAERLVDMILLP